MGTDGCKIRVSSDNTQLPRSSETRLKSYAVMSRRAKVVAATEAAMMT